MSDHDPLSRRAFFGATLAGGALVALDGRAPLITRIVDRAEPIAPARATLAPFELEEVTVAQLGDGMASGRWTAHGIAEQYLARADEIDKTGPAINAILERNPAALEIAARMDAERKAGNVRGPLHGVPVLIKGNIDTADRMTTTAGSLALEGSIAPRDSFVAERLRAAGAVILGKTNLSEWANFRSTHSTSGWSGQGGQTRNPYALDRNPSGSSSGSGSAASANLAAIAVGTETDGSVLSPSSCCGLVGIKPTVGFVSRAGIIPIAHSQDTAGPMARTVTDAALLLMAMSGVDPRDSATRDPRGRSTDFARSLDASGLSGARIGIARESFFGYSPAADAIAEEAIRVMKRAGAIIVDPADITPATKLGDAELEVLLYEFKADLEAYLATLGAKAPVRTMADIIAFNEREKAREMPFFGQEIMEMAVKKNGLTDPAYLKAREKCVRLTRAEGIDATMTKHRLDALVAPTQGPAGLIDHVNGDSGGGSSTQPAAVAGYPSITVPGGYKFGLPVGISFFGRAWSEATLIRLAYAFEQATKVRVAPTFEPTVKV